jgi:hypothetical protein
MHEPKNPINMKTKSTILLVCAWVAYLSNQGWSQNYFQRDLQISAGPLTHQKVGDIYYNASQNIYRSVHQTNAGSLALFTYDENWGSVLSTIELSGNINFDPKEIIDNGTTTYILFQTSIAGQDRFGVASYDNSLNTVNWVNYISNASNNIITTPNDMDVDFNTGDIYITGSRYNTTLFEYECFACMVDNAGNLVWNTAYPITGRDDENGSIFYYSPTEIYIGFRSINTTNILDTKSYVLHIDNTGTLINTAEINYGTYNNCQYYRMKSCCVKRLNNEIFVFIPSAAGPDGEGCYSIAKLDPSLNHIDHMLYKPAITHYYPEFTFTDYDNALTISGFRFNGGGYDGYCTYNISTATLSNLGGYAYPLTYPHLWGAIYMSLAYNPNLNELMSVMDYSLLPTTFHQIKSTQRGNTQTDCSLGIDDNICKCEYIIHHPTLTTLQPTPFFVPVTCSINDIGNKYEEICTNNDCPDCEFKSATISGKQVEFTVYPNPATNYIQVLSNIPAIQAVTIYDLSGKQILSIQNPAITNQQQLDVNELPAGIYILKILQTNEQEMHFKIIKN